MGRVHARKRCVVAVGALSCAVFLSACASIPFDRTVQPASHPQTVQSDEDDWAQLTAQLRADLNRYNSREIARAPVAPAKPDAKSRDTQFAEHARALFAPLSSMALRMPVVGVRPRDLSDSWHDPRDGGKRWHKGIDIFARKGTAVIAVADGIVSYIGDERLGGHCVWLTTENGTAFYYAHLDRWAPGLYEGMEVQAGDLLGFVGNTGNAIHTPSHLHFGIDKDDQMVDPFPLLAHATISDRAHLHPALGGGFGTR